MVSDLAVEEMVPKPGAPVRWLTLLALRQSNASAVVLWTLAKNRTISPPPPSRQGRLFPAVSREPRGALQQASMARRLTPLRLKAGYRTPVRRNALAEHS